MRLDDPDATVLFLLIYLALSTITLLFAGKSGAAINYFIEFLCLWCVWIGWLAGYTVRAFSRFPAGAVCLPIILVAQLYTLPANIQLLHRLQLSPARKAQAESLLNRVRLIPGPLLSDDMVLVRRAGRDVGLEPAILAELAAQGQWDETKLIDMLRRHAFGAVVTAYDPGDPTFDARYLAATRKALLESYPHVEMFGDYRLRLP